MDNNNDIHTGNVSLAVIVISSILTFLGENLDNMIKICTFIVGVAAGIISIRYYLAGTKEKRLIIKKLEQELEKK